MTKISSSATSSGSEDKDEPGPLPFFQNTENPEDIDCILSIVFFSDDKWPWG